MIRMSATGSTTVTVTLYEKATIPTPYFTWWIQRKGSLDTIIFYQDDISLAPYYFNQFTLTVAGTATPGLTSGFIPVTPGEWEYIIYEQSSPYVLATSSTVLENGILQVLGEYWEAPTYANNNPSVTQIPVYR